MLLTLCTTHHPATDLGYLLAKHPARAQAFELGWGYAHVFYPEVTEERCTAALLLDLDPVALVRGRSDVETGLISHYINDRPYVASSFMSVALAQVFGSALGGRCRERPELVETALPLEASLPVVPCRGGEGIVERLFAPLGYEVVSQPVPLDPAYPEWGESIYRSIALRGTVRLSDLMSHLYVLLPALDATKHYFIGDDEMEKLLRHGEGWLAGHPEREWITRRYLRDRRTLVDEALRRLSADDDPEPEVTDDAADATEEAAEERISLHRLRLEAVVAALKASGASRVLDLGCGEGRLLALLLKEPQFSAIAGLDVSSRALERVSQRLHLDRALPSVTERLTLLHGALTYRDERLAGYDAAALVEVIEHLDPGRLAALERVVFEFAQPRTVVVTTPNVEYNVLWPSLPAGELRHRDHRFEWTRAEFAAWAAGVASRHGYTVAVSGLGPEDPTHGAPSQMGVFTR